MRCSMGLYLGLAALLFGDVDAKGAAPQVSNDTQILSTRMFHWKEGLASGLASRADLVVFSLSKVEWQRPAEEVCDRPLVVFVNTRQRGQHQALLSIARDAVSELGKPVVIVIAGDDFTWPRQVDVRSPPESEENVAWMKALVEEDFVHHVWVENLDESFSPKVSPLPLGISAHELRRDHLENAPLDAATLGMYLPFANTNDDRELLASYSGRIRAGEQYNERRMVEELAMDAWAPCMGSSGRRALSHKGFLEDLASYPFAVAVHGGGLDPNPRVWEALMMGSIPIVRRSPTTAIYDTLDFPIVQVDEWTNTTLTPASLAKWYEQYRGHLVGAKRREVLRQLTLEYWWERITDEA